VPASGPANAIIPQAKSGRWNGTRAFPGLPWGAVAVTLHRECACLTVICCANC
jgi:hypothetical protein